MKKKFLITLIALLSTGYVFGQEMPGGLEVGTKAPKLEVDEWLSEVPQTSGKFIALDFWGTSCKPCIAGFPHVNELHKKFKDKVTFIAATTNETPDEVYVFSGPKIDFYSILQKPKAWTDFKVNGIPHMVIVDPQGIVRFSGNGHDVTEKMLIEMISKYGK